MEERFQHHPDQVKTMSTEALRTAFVLTELMQHGKEKWIYSHYDRMITGGIVPVNVSISLAVHEQLKSDFFLQRREIGIINTGGEGTITADGQTFVMNKLDCLYLGRGTRDVSFQSAVAENPAQYFVLSAPAHQTFPNALMKNENATPVALGEKKTANERTIYKYIHEDGIKSCQLVMGLTLLKEGSVWNTMPAHTHNRRMEVYLYFDVAEEQRVFHMMGRPQETRHLLVRDHEAVISPPWSIHSGCGTSHYSFIWGMAGENQSFTDMDFVPIEELR
jgi:4-deoxy-L-threo-5-hexosulose-uronate ketol-isomerase